MYCRSEILSLNGPFHNGALMVKVMMVGKYSMLLKSLLRIAHFPVVYILIQVYILILPYIFEVKHIWCASLPFLAIEAPLPMWNNHRYVIITTKIIVSPLRGYAASYECEEVCSHCRSLSNY